MNISVDIEPLSRMQLKLDEILKRKIERKINLEKIRTIFVRSFETALLAHPTWQSLKDRGIGKLSALFGFRIGTEDNILNPILETWKNSFHVDLNFKNTALVDITIQGVLSSLSDVLNLPAAYIQTKKEELPWLDWLVFRGTTPVVLDYHVVNGLHKNSRSGYAIMTPSGKFSVPGEYAGVPGRNFLTDVAFIVGQARDKEEKTIVREIMRSLK